MPPAAKPGTPAPKPEVKAFSASQTSCISGGLVSKQGFTLALQKLKYIEKRWEAFLILLSNSRA